jgi:hypothetical protein
MGMVKRYWAEVEERGWSEVGTNICSECVVDPALIAAVDAHGGHETCDYCKSTPPRQRRARRSSSY